MSGFFSIFNRNGATIQKEIIDNMLDGISYWKPDERGVFQNDYVVLGHTMLWNTPESKFEHLPLSVSQYVLMMDARIDNRDELASQIELPDRPMGEIGDSEYILGAYRKWGEECPKYLLGDFAFVIWDESKEHLFCARDHVGIKPFYYYLDDEVFVCCNDIKGLVEHPNIPHKLNNSAILHYLHDIEDQSQTFIESVLPLMPATTMIVKSKAYYHNTYWNPEDSPKIKFDNEEMYLTHFRTLLHDTVKVRSRSIFPISSHLSGGLDSSSIGVIAARIAKQNKKTLYAFNWSPPPNLNDDPNYYEWAFSKKIASLEGISHQYIILTAEQLAIFYREQNILFNDKQYIWYEQITRQEAKRHGVRTILSGWGGDEMITNNGSSLYTELFWSGNKVKALSLMYKESQTAKYPLRRFIAKCVRNLYLNQMPCRLNKYISNLGQYQWNEYRCVESQFSALAKTMEMRKNEISRTSVYCNQVSRFKQGHIQNRIDSWNASSFQDRIEYRYPLLDKRVIEFALSIPAELYRKNGIGRYFFRKAVEPLLPYEICWFSTKVEPRRVAFLHQLMFKAQNIWRDESKFKKSFNTANHIINHEKIVKYIDETNDRWHLMTSDEKIESLIVIHRSIMVLQMKL